MNSRDPTPPPPVVTVPSLEVPRVAPLDVVRAFDTPSWRPVSASELALRQTWLPKPEPAFQPGTVWLAASDDALLVFADLLEPDARTKVVEDHEPVWERGDAFEIFVQSFAGEPTA